MLHRIRALGSCALSVVLVVSLTSILSGFSAPAEEAPIPRGDSEITQPEKPLEPGSKTAQVDEPAGENPLVTALSDPPVEEGGEADGDPADKSDPPNAEPLETEAAAVFAQTEEEGLDRGILIEGSTLYANGVAVVIKKDSAGKTCVFDGSGTEELAPSPGSLSTVYGGGKNTPVDGDTSVRIEGVSSVTVYGGGFSDGSGSADVSGNASVVISGNADAGTVHGGGNANASRGDASANVAGSASVVVSATPKGNHGHLYGGGSAVSQKGYSASASVGSAYASVVGRTYSVRGGGSASLAIGATGSAVADVGGSVEVVCADVDIREVYGAGYADGANTRANAGSVSVSVDGGEAMIVQGGGDASKGAQANVAGSVDVRIRNCSNLYGYVLGGGNASGGATAQVGSTSVEVIGSCVPVSRQFDSLVAAATYAGGSASGEGSDASVLDGASLRFVDCEGGGNMYGGGDASGGARATVGDLDIAIIRLSQTEFEGTLYSGSLFAGGESDDPSVSEVGPGSISVSVEGCYIEHLWGGVLVKGAPTSSLCTSSLELLGTENHLQTLTCFDKVALSSPLEIDAFLEKAPGVPTELSVSGIAFGDLVVICKDADSLPNWFSRSGGELAYAIEQVDGEPASVWRMGKTEVGDIEVVVPDDPKAPSVSVENVGGLAERLLTDEDRSAMEQGSIIGFALHVEMVDEVSPEVAPVVEHALLEHGCTLAYHLDIKLVKSVDGVESPVSSVQQAGSGLRFCAAIPPEAIAENRTFSVMRFHKLEDGTFEVTELEDLDADPATITFETDRFSVYSLVYEDSAPNDPSDPGNPGGDSGNGNQPGDSGEDPLDPGGSHGGAGGQTDAKPLPQGGSDSGKSAYGAKPFPTTGDVLGDAAAAGIGIVVCAALIAASARLRRWSAESRRK